MTTYLVQPRDQMFLKSYRFLSSAKSMGKNIGKNISKNVAGKYCQKFLIMLNNLQQMRLKQLQKQCFEKQQKQLVIWLVIKLLIKISKNSQQNNSKTVTNKLDKEIPKRRYIYPEERQEIIDELRLNYYNNGISENHRSFKKFTTENLGDCYKWEW